MKKKPIDLRKLSEEEKSKMMNKHRIKVLSKFVNKNYLKSEESKSIAVKDLKLLIKEELIKGLDEEFSILQDDPDDPLIEEMVRDKTEEIIKEIYK